MNAQQRNELIKTRNFYKLFIEQGFDNPPSRNNNILLPRADSSKVTAELICQKRGFVVCTCEINNNAEISKAEINKLLRELSKSHYENILIIYGKDSNGHEEQQWIVSIRPQNRPLQVINVQWYEKKSNQLLEEKLQGLIFPLEGEEGLTISDVVQRVRSAFIANSEKITKKFYEKFKQQLNIFEEFIEGIENLIDKKQYAALMLNRLMFVYFIQKKGFLDGNINYLQERLEQVKKQYGNNQFHDKFYREFLRRLFKEGLDTPVEQRDSTISKLLGKVPYLNGGLFDAHRLETDNLKINLSDKAFENIFNFFGQYQWHLDSRPTASGDEINPDVLGYIFEKYINDRAQMGAYYTQEDITEYIAKNTILPYLLQQAEEECRNAFTADSSIWRFLRENPDNYIYDAVKYGCDLSDDEIPENIHQGLDSTTADLLARRRDWNTTATEKFALPKETWREVIARRQRYCEVKEKINNGEIERVEDLITYNLDIVRFVADTLKNYEGSDFIDVIFRTIAGVRDKWVTGTNSKVRRGISILDPSCGSGAFLFAALNILQPLYKICIERMEEFVAADDHRIEQKGGKEKYPLFRRVLEEIEQHPNQEYWIYKTIILENLYGVDIMAEAAEIAKLRLFLQLAASAEYDKNKANLGLEPLPDIDYNIRAGNSLVGFANMKHFNFVCRGQLAGLDVDLEKRIRQQANKVKMANVAFRQAQEDCQNIAKEKKKLAGELEKLNKELNGYLALSSYGIDSNQSLNNYKEWKHSHQPFHWLAEFYGIIEENGGFDVVIGNPPYVEYNSIKDTYTIKDYSVEKSGNLYAYFMERIVYIKNKKTLCSMIVPLSGHSTKRMKSLVDLYYRQPKQQHWVFNISADANPSILFPGVKFRLAIFISIPGERQIYTTGYKKWYSEERNNLFSFVQFTKLPEQLNKCTTITKVASNLHKDILMKMEKINNRYVDIRAGEVMYYHNAPVSWIRVHNTAPFFKNERHGEHVTIQLKKLFFKNREERNVAFLIFASSTFYLWWLGNSDCYHLNKTDITSFPLILTNEMLKNSAVLSQELETDMQHNSLRRVYNYKNTGRVEYDEFYMKKSKTIIDKIDCLLADAYGFTEEELDYIINYSYKYRMGSEA